jgi:Bifunctional DNA primase/polymerase, N-terminal
MVVDKGNWPGPLVLIPAGSRTGFFCLDIDADDGVAAWAKLEAKYGQAPTRVHITPFGRQQRIYLWDPNRPIKGSRGNLPNGIDVLGEGQGIVAPGTYLEDGRRYGVLVDIEPTPAPQWIYDILLAPPQQQP